MNPNLEFTVGKYFMVPCPKCGKGHFFHEWGKQKCLYENCDGHEWVVEFNFEIAKQMLSDIEAQNKKEWERRKEKPMSKWTPPKLQRVLNGWISVPQF